MPAPDKLPKHHYIPVLYLNEWRRPDGRLTEFSRPTGQAVIPRRTSPKGTGYARGLYRLDGSSEETSEAFERVFFHQVDNLAKDALDICLGRSRWNWTIQTRSAWSRFVLGLLFRNPERIAATRKYVEDMALENYEENEADYNAKKKLEDPSFLDYVLGRVQFNTMDFATSVIDNIGMGTHINQMRWSIRDVSDSGISLFTSDRPIIMTNGLNGPDAHLALPISPHKVFLACKNKDQEQKLLAARSSDFASECNKRVLRFAMKYAWNTDDTMINRANEHLGKDTDIGEEFWQAPINRALSSVEDHPAIEPAAER